jgi:WD40 repeat protein
MRIAVFLSLLITTAPATAVAQTELTYWQDIRPIFRKHCTACHATKHIRKIEVSGGLALDTYDAAMKGAKAPVVTPGKSAKSVLHDLLVTTDVKKRMPLDTDPLSKEKIELIKKWIDSGAKEGTPPPEVATAPATKKTPTRKLDVLIPIDALLPAGIAGQKVTGKLTLSMKIGPLAPVTAVAFSPDSNWLAAGSYGQVVIWDLRKAEPVKLLTNVLGAVNDVRFSPKGDILAVAGGQPSAKGDLRLYQTSDWKLLGALRGHDDVVFSVAFSPDGTQLASASFDHTVKLWNVKTHEAVKDYHHHSDFVYAVAFSPNGKQLVSASKDRTVQLFDVTTGKGAFTFSGMEQDVMAVAFHPDGKSVVSSGFESALWWWNPLTGEKLKTTAGHGIAVHELTFSKDGKRIVSAGADRTVRTFDGGTGAVVKVYPVGSVAYSVAISDNGKRIAAGSFDGLVRLWDEASGRQLASLLAYAADGEQLEWLAVTPEGYAVGSDKLLALSRWRMADQELRGEVIWRTLHQSALVVRALRGETLAAPKFITK